jgi:hypothetical protein
MKKLSILFFTALVFNLLNAQTGIGTTTPNTSAKLDVFATNKGFLPPRVTLTSTTDASTITSPAVGLLVYNVGSVGLQAGYYYWNGANWATIATASSAGNGVMASELVKLYQEGYSTTSGKAPSTSGYSFTVPVSGRYEFNFNSTGWNTNGSTIKLTFNIRSGSTVLASDYHQSISSNVWAEYEGRVEVNLNAGEIYNVQVVTTTGNRDYRDYDKIFYKQIAGNLPVTGQSVDYVSVSRTGSDQTVNTNSVIIFNTINGGNIPYNTSTGLFSLTAGKTYKLIGGVSISNGNNVAKEVNFVWKNTAGDALGTKGELLSPSAAVDAAGNGIAYAIYTPTTNTTVSLNVTYSSASTILWQNYTFASIEQIGSSAIINPWTLSGTNTYNTTGNVGIGTNSPTQALDIVGNVNVTGKINVTDPAGNVATKAAGFVARGVDVTLGNLKVRFAATGNMSLQVSTVTGTYSVYGSQVLVSGAVAYSAIDGAAPLSVTTTPVYLNSVNAFGGAGNTSTWNIMDTNAGMSWRISMIVGAGYNNNFISIERLL